MGILSINNGSFMMDGKPFRIISGSVHYFRVVPQYWEDRLRKLKECGFNTVEFYSCWNLHERHEGCFDFSNNLDIEKYILTAQKLGLYVLFRPGPYICGEWDMGGLPSWLLTVPGLKLRCNNEIFLQKVRNYYKELFKIIRPHLSTNGGNIIMVQIENEYGSFGDDREYMKAIREIYRENDINCLMFTSDGPGYFMLEGGSLPDELATINFGSNPKDNFALLKSYRPDAPLMCTEYWNGWFDHWYEEHHTRNSGDTAQVFREMLDMGASVNLYTFHGGTNFNFYNGANYDNGLQPTITSYDYNCPVSECGDLTDKYFEIRKVMEDYYKGIGNVMPELTVKNSIKKNYGRVALTEYSLFIDAIKNNKLGYKTESSSYLKTMEELDADFGFVLYSSTFRGPMEELELTIEGLGDRANIFLNNKFLGIKENTGRRDDKISFAIKENETAEIDILVENLGRVNYGGHITDPKGISGGVRLANRYHYDWLMTPVGVDDISNIEFTGINNKTDDLIFKRKPVFLRGYFETNDLFDTFVRLDGFDKGCVWINGFNLGRYWNTAGPQHTLYLPGPLLRKGRNVITVLELDAFEKPEIKLTDKEDLG